MSDFDTTAFVHLQVPDGELRNVRQQVEDAIGTTELGMTDGGTMSAQATAAGGGGRARRRARREYRWARERTDLLDEAVAYLEDIEDQIGEGGGGGGVLDDLVGSVTETAGDVAVEGGGAVVDVATDSLSTAIGTAVADAITGSAIDVEKPSWTPLEVEDVGPLEVEEPDPIPVEEPGGDGPDTLPPIEFEESPDPYPLEEPPGTYPVEDVGPLEVEDIDPIAVEKPEWVPLEVQGRDGSDSPGGDNGPFDWIGRRITEGLDWMTPEADIESGGDGETPADWIDRRVDEGVDWITQSGGDQSSGSGSAASRQVGQPSITQDVSVSNSPTYNTTLEADASSIADAVIDDLEREFQSDIDELRRDLEDLKQDLEDAIRRSGGVG